MASSRFVREGAFFIFFILELSLINSPYSHSVFLIDYLPLQHAKNS